MICDEINSISNLYFPMVLRLDNRIQECYTYAAFLYRKADGFNLRWFTPLVEIDPVTGSAHCCLCPFWKQRLNKNEFVAYQASARGGIVRVRLSGKRVHLGGQAVTVMCGELAC